MTTDTRLIRTKPNMSDPAARNLKAISDADAAAEPPEDQLYYGDKLARVPDPPNATNHTEPAKPARSLPTFTIHALIDDFPFEVSFSGNADQLAATVQRLRAIGAVPPTPAARAAVEAERERTAPVCEFHGPMKESSKRPGTYYCPAKMGDNSYCKSKG